MRTITIGNAPSLTKDHYDSEIELQIQLESAQSVNGIHLTEEEDKMLEKRAEEAEKPDFKGLTVEELKASIVRKNA